MHNLINVTLNENQEPVVSARDLHKGLEISKRFSAWFEQNSKLFIENEEFTSVPKGTPVIGGNGNIQYLVLRKMTTFLKANIIWNVNWLTLDTQPRNTRNWL